MSPGVKPLAGSSSAPGGSKRKGWPSAPIKVSVIGLKDNLPEKAIAVTISGELCKSVLDQCQANWGCAREAPYAKKFIVLVLPSFLPLKFLLKEVKMARQNTKTFVSLGGVARGTDRAQIAAHHSLRPGAPCGPIDQCKAHKHWPTRQHPRLQAPASNRRAQWWR